MKIEITMRALVVTHAMIVTGWVVVVVNDVLQETPAFNCFIHSEFLLNEHILITYVCVCERWQCDDDGVKNCTIEICDSCYARQCQHWKEKKRFL